MFLQEIGADDWDRYYGSTTFLIDGDRLMHYIGRGVYYRSNGCLGGYLDSTGVNIPRESITSITLPRLGYYKGGNGSYASRIPLRSAYKGLCSANVNIARDMDVVLAMQKAGLKQQNDLVFIPEDYVPWVQAVEQVLSCRRLLAVLDSDTALVTSFMHGNPRIKHKGVPIAELLPDGSVVAYRGTCNIFKQTEGLRGVNFTTDWEAKSESSDSRSEALHLQPAA